jgi:hypothetical protein
MVMLQQQTIMPFIMQQQLHMPPASIVQRFCTILEAVLSSHEHIIFIPPVHFSSLIVHRGTIIQLAAAGMLAGVPIAAAPMPGIPIPGIPIPVRSIIMLDILHTPSFCSRPAWPSTKRPDPSRFKHKNLVEPAEIIRNGVAGCNDNIGKNWDFPARARHLQSGGMFTKSIDIVYLI